MTQAMIIVESMFGNTSKIAEAIADGMRDSGREVSVVAADQAPATPQADLVVVGAPTHNLGLPSPSSRAKTDSGVQRGVREWLDSASLPQGVRVAAFDTQLGSMFSGSATKKIARGLKQRGGDVVAQEEFIVVAGSPATLRGGELERARAWGASLR